MLAIKCPLKGHKPDKLLATKRPVFVLKGQTPKKVLATSSGVPFLFRTAEQLVTPVEGKVLFAKTWSTLSLWFKVIDANSRNVNLESELQRTLKMRDAGGSQASSSARDSHRSGNGM